MIVRIHPVVRRTISLALAAVMRENATRPDFAPEGTTELKPWFGANLGIALPPEIDIPIVLAVAPYNDQIAQLSKQIGALLPRQNMKDASGASQMDAQVGYTFQKGSRLDGFGIVLQVSNVLDSPYRTYFDVSGVQTLETFEKYGRSWLLGASYHF